MMVVLGAQLYTYVFFPPNRYFTKEEILREMKKMFAYIGSSLWMSIKLHDSIRTCDVALIEDEILNKEYSFIFNKEEQEFRLAWDW